jgi:hypothetical protein
MNNIINYPSLIDEAMHIVLKKILNIILTKGLDDDRHFFISFMTRMKGVIIPERLRNKYPQEMTIILQYQFENLKISDEGFAVRLSFDGVKENIVIPFNTITSFADPLAKFSWKFSPKIDIDDNSEGMQPNKKKPAGNIIYMDKTRFKKT